MKVEVFAAVLLLVIPCGFIALGGIFLRSPLVVFVGGAAALLGFIFITYRTVHELELLQNKMRELESSLSMLLPAAR